MISPRIFELEWYRLHRKYEERIKRGGPDGDYVIGDDAWNRKFPDRAEYVESSMRAARQASKPTPL